MTDFTGAVLWAKIRSVIQLVIGSQCRDYGLCGVWSDSPLICIRLTNLTRLRASRAKCNPNMLYAEDDNSEHDYDC